MTKLNFVCPVSQEKSPNVLLADGFSLEMCFLISEIIQHCDITFTSILFFLPLLCIHHSNFYLHQAMNSTLYNKNEYTPVKYHSNIKSYEIVPEGRTTNPSSNEQLKSISPQTGARLVSSIPRNIQSVIENKDRHTQYFFRQNTSHHLYVAL